MAPQVLKGAWCARIVTLFPEAFPGTLGLSLTGKALNLGLWALETIDLRPFGIGKHKNVDDNPAGGGAGMVLRADVVAAALDQAAIGTPMTEQLDRDGYLTIVGGTGDIILSPSGSKPVVALNLGNLEEGSSGIPATLPWAVTDGIIGGWATTSDALDMNGQSVTGARSDSSSAMSFGDLTLRPTAQTLPLSDLSRTAGSNITLNGGALSYDAPSTPPSLNTVQTTAGVISGSAGVTKVGGGILTLTGSNTFTGGTNVNAGVVSIESQASSALTITGGTTNVNGTPITKAGTGSGSVAGTGMRTLTLSGSSTADNAKQAGDCDIHRPA